MRQRGFIRRQALRFLKGFPCRREIVLVAEHGGLALPAGRAQGFIRRRFQGVDKFLFFARRVGFQIATEQGIGCFFRSCIELGQVAEQVFKQGDGILLASIFQPVSGDQGQGFRMQIENRQARQLLAGKLHQHLRQHQFLGNTQFWPVNRSTALLEFAARSAQARRVAFRSCLFPWPEAIFRNRRRVPDFQRQRRGHALFHFRQASLGWNLHCVQQKLSHADHAGAELVEGDAFQNLPGCGITNHLNGVVPAFGLVESVHVCHR